MVNGIVFDAIQIDIHQVIEHGHEPTRSVRIPFVPHQTRGMAVANANANANGVYETVVNTTTTAGETFGFGIKHVLGLSIIVNQKGFFQRRR